LYLWWYNAKENTRSKQPAFAITQVFLSKSLDVQVGAVSDGRMLHITVSVRGLAFEC
jgi:hypothetical protein